MGFGGVRRLFEGRVDLDSHLHALERVAQGDRQAVTAAFLELAEIYRRQERHDFASLVSYRAMEAIVETGLLTVNSRFQMNQPDYGLLGDVAALEAEAHALLDRSPRRPLPPKVGLEAGFALLLILGRVRREPFDSIQPA